MIKNRLNNRTTLIVLIVILVELCFISLVFGPVSISFRQALDIILHKIGFFINDSRSSFDSIHISVLWDIRIPRMIMGFLVGIALGTSGAILQGLFRNPLVDPGFIGVSSGAAVGAMVSIMFSSSIELYFPNAIVNFILPVLAILGALVTTLMIYVMSKVSSKTNIMAMLLSGIAVNALAGAIIGLFISISSDSELRTFTFWTLGGLDNANWLVVTISGLFILTSFAIIYFKKNQLDIFMLGDAEAHNLGVNVERLKRMIILIASIMVGISVSFCGMIGFIGLVTPHLVRLFISSKHKYLIPGSAVLGAILLISSDLISKTIISPAQLPIGVVTSIIGAPFFIWLIFKQKSRLGYSA